ncbi:iron-containing alcohol dehydrogenase [Frankia sp. AgB32]|uniref:iron-containing alcohol dehydrogenase n=1 Tax=Frankia sp. AgB32 TaxID=631119 RepID=UPI0020102B51|nr:iron-containing alcohol dehydrogenase [Frankia sp. AgB32]MCK9896091.1 iron-containing alcohol dehydrogenase [Frankia sp. AgB32]
MCPPELINAAGSVSGLARVVGTGRRVLVVASARAFRAAGVAELLADNDVAVFSGFTPNPRLPDVLAGCRLRDGWRPEVIVGLGGGSALDVAKMVRLLPADPERARAALHRFEPPDQRPPLVLVPTTAGPGTEVTRFATVFDGDTKLSLDHAAVLADVAVVDPDLAASCPSSLVGSCAFDALCHAVESWWSRRSTPRSREFAGEALRALVPLLRRPVAERDAAYRGTLAGAALAAGRAIDLTRTTAAHAFAYRLTTRYGVPHGVACLLNLRWLLPLHLAMAQRPGVESRVVEHVTDIVEVLGLAGRERTDCFTDCFTEYFTAFGWSPRLRDYGIGRDALPSLVDAGLATRARAGNNPIELDRDLVLRAMATVL